MADLEARELRYFTAVARELSFSRAAERLGMAQPPLSRAIQRLERRLGVRLFERSSRGVALTAAGETLRTEAEHALEAMSAAAHRTRRAGLATPSLVATAKPGVATGLLRHLVDSSAAVSDAPRVEVVVSGFGEQVAMIRDGRADVAVIGSPYDHRGLDVEPLISEPRVAALPVDHPLARRTTLRCRDLAGVPMPQWPEASAAERAYWTGRDQDETRFDVASTTGPAIRDSAQLLEAVALGQAVALVPESLAGHNVRADVTYRPVSDASSYTLAIAWAEGIRDTRVAQLVQTAVELVADRELLRELSDIA